MTTTVTDKPGWVGRAERGELPPGAALPLATPIDDLIDRTETALEAYPPAGPVDGVRVRFVTAVRAAIEDARAELRRR